MVILVNSGSNTDGLAYYLLYGTNSSRDNSKVEVIDGDLELTKQICKNSNYKDKHYHMILSIDGKLSNEKMKNLYEDFKEELFYAYGDNEVSISAVLHQDTDNSHIHCVIPKKNLFTDRKLELYYDKRDRKRFETIRDYLDKKHNLKSPTNKQLSSLKKIDAQVKNWNPNTQVYKTKKEKAEFEKLLLNHLSENMNDKFSNHNEMMSYLKNDLELNIKKIGYDYKKDAFYATFLHDEKTIQRVFTPLFNDGKLKYILNKNGEKVYQKENFSICSEKVSNNNERELNQIREKLDTYNNKFKAFIDKRTASARKKAHSKFTQENDNSTPSPILEQNPPNSIKSKKKVISSLLGYNNKKYRLYNAISKLNLSNLLIERYSFEMLKNSATHNILKNKNNEKFIFYRDNNGIYNFKNIFNPNQTGTLIDFLKNFLKIPSIIDLIPTINIIPKLHLTPVFIEDISKFIDDFILKKSDTPSVSKNQEIKEDVSYPDLDPKIDRDLRPRFTMQQSMYS